MGRYAQAQRRGTSRPAEIGPGAPPAPGWVEDGLNLLTVSNSISNEGGTIRLWRRPAPEDPRVLYADHAWASGVNWGEKDEFPAGWYDVNEEGNGVDYSGISAYSIIWLH